MTSADAIVSEPEAAPRAEPGSEPLRLVVGLGNPGARYEQTRHNIGFDVVAELLEGRACSRRFFEGGSLVEAEIAERPILFLCPGGYMNRSGGPVRRAVTANQLVPASVLVICDDYALPLGAIRARRRGSDGGHNGLASVFGALGTQLVPRLRLGVGAPPPGTDPADHVLAPFEPGEMETGRDLVVRAAEAVVTAIRDGLDVSMNRYNRTSA